MDEHDNKTGSQKQGGWTPGQWAVWNDASRFLGADPRYETAEILKATPKTVTTRSIYGHRENRRMSEDMLWAGPEAGAKALVERLSSSVGLMKDEIRRSRERHAERAAKLLSRANPSTDQGGE